MSSGAELHNAARRYLMERLSKPTGLIDEILIEVERFVPGDFADTAEARELLAECGRWATSRYLGRVSTPELHTEFAYGDAWGFIQYVSEVDEAELGGDQIPYRRTLADREVEAYTRELVDRWGVAKNTRYWYPLVDQPAPSDVVVLDSDYWVAEIERGAVRDLVGMVSASPIIEIREWGGSCETDARLLRPWYPGDRGEGLFTDQTFGWLIYASHEQTVALGGSGLIEALHRLLPHWREGAWHGFPQTRPSIE